MMTLRRSRLDIMSLLQCYEATFNCGQKSPLHRNYGTSVAREHLFTEEPWSTSGQTAQQMLINNLIPAIQTCRQRKDLACAKRLHLHIRKLGLDTHGLLGNYLVPMLAECGSMSHAQQVFDRLLLKTEHSWTSLILGYVQCEQWQLAVDLHQKMRDNNVYPTTYTLVGVLKACSKLKNLKRGREIHLEISQEGFEDDLHVCRTLMSMYVKCGSPREAHEVFEKLSFQNVVSWNVLISGYAEYGPSKEALRCFECMQQQGLSPNAITIGFILKACGNIGALDIGCSIYKKFAQKNVEVMSCVGNTMIGLYAKCGSLAEAQRIFDKLCDRDVVSWTALIAGYAEHGPSHEAIRYFENMHDNGVAPNDHTFSCVLKACGSIGAVAKGQEIHEEITREGFELDLEVGNCLIDMYMKCGFLLEAQEVFDELPFRDVVSWTTLTAGYAEHGFGDECLKYIEQMRSDGIFRDSVMFIASLKALSRLGAIDQGRTLHAEIAREGMELDVSISNTLIGMYAKCGVLLDAHYINENMLPRNVVSWTSLMVGYAECGLLQDALSCFELMKKEGICPNDITFSCVLKACGNFGLADKGIEIHKEIAAMSMDRDIAIAKTLVGMYAKCGLLSQAEEVFANIQVPDVMCWTALITGYAEYGSSQEGLNCFEQMQNKGVLPNLVTYICTLKSCGSIGALEKGCQILIDIIKRGYERDSMIANSLISMFAKCASLSEAHEIFLKLSSRDVIAWSTMIKGYGVNNEGYMAIQCFEDMQEQGVKPDAATFVCLLTACSHANLLLEGQELFIKMIKEHKIVPNMEHCACMVDLLARSGRLYEAEHFLKVVHFPLEETWAALLGASRTYGESALGRRCFQQLVQMNPKDATSYVVMMDIYVSNSKWDDATMIEEMRKQADAEKMAAVALLELHEVFEFMVGSSQRYQISEMLNDLNMLVKDRGHVPDLVWSKIDLQ